MALRFRLLTAAIVCSLGCGDAVDETPMANAHVVTVVETTLATDERTKVPTSFADSLAATSTESNPPAKPITEPAKPDLPDPIQVQPTIRYRIGRMGGSEILVGSAGRHLFALSGSHLHVWHLETRSLTRRIPGVQAVALSPSGKRFATLGSEGLVKVWDLDDPVVWESTRPAASLLRDSFEWGLYFGLDEDLRGPLHTRAVAELERHSGTPISTVQFADTSATTVLRWATPETLICGQPGQLILFDLKSGDQLARHDSKWSSVDVSSGGRLLAIAGEDQVEIRRIPDWQLVGSFQISAGQVRFTADGRRLAAAGVEGLRVWELGPESENRLLYQHKQGATGLAFSTDGHLLASLVAGREIAIHDLNARAVSRRFPGILRSSLMRVLVADVEFVPGELSLITSEEGGVIKYWQLDERPDPDVVKAIETMAREEVSSNARLRSVDMMNGVSGKVQPTLAADLLETAAAEGDVLARVWIACHLAAGSGSFRRNFAQAQKLFAEQMDELLAMTKSGDAEAQYLLARAGWLGLADVGEVEQRRLLRAAASRGQLDAMTALADRLSSGGNGPCNDILAVEWYSAAAHAGHAQAMAQLSSMIRARRGVPIRDKAAMAVTEIWGNLVKASANRQPRPDAAQAAQDGATIAEYEGRRACLKRLANTPIG